MSSIQKIKQNFRIEKNIPNTSDTDFYNKMPNINPLRRNKSEIFKNRPLEAQKSYNFKSPTEIQSLNQTLGSNDKSLYERGFNPANHIPPKFDIYGYLKPLSKRREDISVLSKKNNMKYPWISKNTNKSGASTQTELIQIRKKEKIPDISYDLDRDGYVGGRDLVIAKRYDIDKDGKLNEKEKKEAYEGIAKGIEEEYVWNVDNQGGKRPFRLLQKRGKFIDAEDFWPIRETYPIHPISNFVPKCSTYTDLKKLRKEQNIKDINKNLSAYEEKDLNKLLYVSDNITNKSLKKPFNYSLQKKKDEEIKNARIKCGLNPVTSDVRDLNKHPGLEYIYSPEHKTTKDLNEAYRRENLEESKKLSNVNHKTAIERLNDRENEIFYKIYSEKEGQTYTKIKEQKKKETNEFNLKVFSKQTIGVHGHDLPKFSQSKSNKEFWKLKEGYCENPKFNSQCEYLESFKYYKPPGEDLLLNEHREEEPKWVDPFKKVHILEAKKKKENLITKINNINIFENFDPNNPRPLDLNNLKKKHIYKWTTLVNQFAPNKFKRGRFFDAIKEEGEKKKEIEKENENIFMKFKGFFEKAKNDKLEEKKNIGPNNMEILGKDCLFQKYSSLESKPKILPKNSSIITKAF